jgi:hypothetical protein
VDKQFLAPLREEKLILEAIVVGSKKHMSEEDFEMEQQHQQQEDHDFSLEISNSKRRVSHIFISIYEKD